MDPQQKRNAKNTDAAEFDGNGENVAKSEKEADLSSVSRQNVNKRQPASAQEQTHAAEKKTPSARRVNNEHDLSGKKTVLSGAVEQNSIRSGKTDTASHIYIHDKFYSKPPFFKNFYAHKILALDIEPDKIRYVVLRKAGSDIQIKKWDVQKFPVEEKDRLKAIQIALENIKARVYKRGMKIHASIFSPEISIRQLIFPKMKNKKELEQALFHKNEEDLKNFDEHSIWNYEILDEFEQEGLAKYRIMITAVPQNVVVYYTHIFKNAGLTLNHLSPRPAAIQKAYRKMVFRPDRDMVINIEYDLTQMCFMKGGELEFIRNVSIGARNLEVSIRQNQQAVKPPEEETSPVGTASEGSTNVLRQRLLSKIKDLKNKQNPVLHTFFSEILRSLAFIQGRDINRFVERIFITGYGVRKESLLPYLRSRVSLPLFVLAPQFTPNGDRTMEYAEYFSTLGTGAEQSNIFNILPASYKKNIVYKKLNVALISILIPLAFLLTFISFKQGQVIKQKESLISMYQQEYETLNPIEGQYLQVQKEIGIVHQKNEELQGFVKNRPPIIPVLKIFSNETPRSVRFIKIVFTHIGEDEKSLLDKFRNDYQYKIDVTGRVITDPLLGEVTLINYINRLVKLKYFKQVQLLNKIKDEEQKTIRFGIRLYL